MSKLEELEQKVVDTKAAYTVAPDAYRDAALAAYVKAINELKEYKERDNE